MKKRRVHTYKLIAVAVFAVGAMTMSFSSLAVDKLRPEEIIAKHLESIGAVETRSSIHNRIVAGTINATMRSPNTGKFSGQCVMASEGSKNMIGMGFEGEGKFEEKFAFDGGNVNIPFAHPGTRGYWGDFLVTHDNIIKEGLVGGVLSDSWPLLNLSAKKAKLESRDVRKIDGKSVYEIKYLPHGSSDLEISLFFDAETFQHVRTEYSGVISAGLGNGRIGTGRVSSPSQSGAIDASGSQRVTRYKMVEVFGNFGKEAGLTLPHSYKIDLEFEARGGTLMINWDFTLTQFAFNQAIPPATFSVK